MVFQNSFYYAELPLNVWSRLSIIHEELSILLAYQNIVIQTHVFCRKTYKCLPY